jgi:hypothetical protein
VFKIIDEEIAVFLCRGFGYLYMLPSIRMCICNMYKYLLLEFTMYTMCVNVCYDYLFVCLLEVAGCSSCYTHSLVELGPS